MQRLEDDIQLWLLQFTKLLNINRQHTQIVISVRKDLSSFFLLLSFFALLWKMFNPKTGSVCILFSYIELKAYQDMSTLEKRMILSWIVGDR